MNKVPKTKEEMAEPVIASIEKPATLGEIVEAFEEEWGVSISKEHVRKTAMRMADEGKIRLEKEAAKNYLILKVYSCGREQT